MSCDGRTSVAVGAGAPTFSSARARPWQRAGSNVGAPAAGSGRGWLLGVVLGCLAAGAAAAATREFQIRDWQLEDGLPDASVTAVAQTPDGFLWVGTPRGLARFDGVTFRIFVEGAASGLPESSVGGLLTAADGRLWVAGIRGSLAYLDGTHFHTVSPPPGVVMEPPGFVQAPGATNGQAAQWMWGQVGELAQDAEGGLWLGAGGRGLLRLHDGKSTLLTVSNGLPTAAFGAFCGDAAGRLWLANEASLFEFHAGIWRVAPGAGNLGGPLPRLAAARAGGVWVATPRGSWIAGGGVVRRFADGQWHDGPAPTPWTPNSLRSQVTALLEDRTSRLWLGTLWGGVYFTDAAGGWQPLVTEGPFAQCVITCLFEDRQGSLWVGTSGEGLHRVSRQPVTVVTLPPPHDQSIITTSAATRDGSVWIGTDGAGAWRLRDGELTPFGLTEGLAHQHVCALLETREGTLWAGTWGGLCRLEDGKFRPVSGPPELRRTVLALFEDDAGSLWIGTPPGLVRHRDGEFSLHPLRADGGTADIRAIASDGRGAVWVGTIGRGLFRLADGRSERFGPAQGFTSANARAVFRDREGTMLVGSDGDGLFRFADGRFVQLTMADGLPSDSISCILSDGEDHLWMSSGNGIFGCARSRLAEYAPGRGPALLGFRLGLAEGLASRGCSGSGQPVASRSADGRLWFPNMRGLAVFDPRAITQPRPVAQARIEGLLADGVKASPAANGGRQAPSSTRRYEFHYTAPELVAPQALRFRHRLEGMDAGWVDAGSQRVAHYSRLPPGEYRFHVMVGGADGHWREGGGPLALRVVPRLWELRWVQVSAAMLLLAGVIGGYAWNAHRRLQRQLERLRMQHALEDERRRIARDLHDDVGARLTEIVLLGELAKRGEQTPVALQSQVGGITGKVRQLVTAMEEIVWTVNPRNDSLPNLAAFLADSTERYLAAADLSCRVEVAPGLPALPVNAPARHNLLLAVKEALNNAVRHAAATQARLSIQLDDRTLRVAVADDGRGFDPAAPARQGNGLTNLRARLESVGGRTEIQSAPGQGTRVCFALPLRQGRVTSRAAK